jgi:hypothetical protein
MSSSNAGAEKSPRLVSQRRRQTDKEVETDWRRVDALDGKTVNPAVPADRVDGYGVTSAEGTRGPRAPTPLRSSGVSSKRGSPIPRLRAIEVERATGVNFIRMSAIIA